MAVLVLALGIGANSVMFTAVHSILLRPLPYGSPDRIAVILTSSEQRGGTMPVTPGDFQDYRTQSRMFEDIAAASLWSPTLTGSERAERMEGLRASTSLFDVLQVKPVYGRLFNAGDGDAGAPPVVVLTYDLFTRRFDDDPSIVGRTLMLDGVGHTVVGITARDFRFPPFWAVKADFYAATSYRPSGENGRGPGFLRLFGRLRSGATIEQANAELRAIAARLATIYPRTNAGLTAKATPIHEMSVGNVRPVLLVLLGAVGCTLVIACANVANLLIARASTRSKEMAIRQSLGAERFHLIRQFLTESAVLAAAGGAAGLVLAWWAVPAIVAAIPETAAFHLPRRNEIRAGSAVVFFNLAVCLFTAIACGLAAAIQSSRVDVNAGLKEAGRGQIANRGGRRTRNLLAATEIAIALLLLTGAGLLTESYRKLHSVDPGFDPSGVLAVNVGLAASGHSQPESRAQFYREALARFRSLPGVTAASAVNHVPLAGDRFGVSITIEDHPAHRPQDTPNAVYRVAMPDYFQAMRIRLMKGRDFSEADGRNAPGVVVVNEAAAKRFWPGENPIGKRIHRGDARSDRPWLTVIGVVAGVKQGDWAAVPDSEIYFPFEQDPDYRANPASFLTMTLVVRAHNAASLAPAIREQIAAIDRNISVPNVYVMEDVIRDATWQPRTSMRMVLFFGGFAALLAAVGIYAVMSYVVSGRTQEIGVRMALGARRIDVVWLVMRDAAGPIAAGLAAGIAAAAGTTRWMSSMLYGVEPLDPGVFGAVTVAVALVALAACLAPAKRASGLDPLAALRQE